MRSERTEGGSNEEGAREARRSKERERERVGGGGGEWAMMFSPEGPCDTLKHIVHPFDFLGVPPPVDCHEHQRCKELHI
eukprot:4964210-Pyramimonas_sp.AAC.1